MFLQTFKKIVILSLLVFIHSNAQIISEVDFVLGATYTGSILWDNFVGISIQYENSRDVINNSLYQAYQMNSNLKGNWINNWVVSIKIPLGHKFNCSGLAKGQANSSIVCDQDTMENNTYWQVLGQYILNTANPPNWCMGYDMQGVDLTDEEHQQIFYNWIYRVYESTYHYLFCAEIVDYGDKMVQRGYKDSYTPQDFIADIEMANYIIFQIGHSGPGITDQASPDWLLAVEAFNSVSFSGHFTVRCIVFPDSSQITIEKVLSDNSSKYYLKERFMVNQTYGYSSFRQLSLGINDIKLTIQPGVDGVTNTFAAALWAVDIAIQFGIMSGWEIDFNHKIFNENFQALLGPEPDLKPQALYYGLMFATLVRQGPPQIIVPSTKAHISSKIKAFGFTTGQVFKIVLLNKDTNTSLNGKVHVKSQLTGTMNCLYMQAPSLDSKDKITIAGYDFIGGNATVNGSFKIIKVQYNHATEGYDIPIKYAQAALCTTADQLFKWPEGTSKKFENTLLYSLSFILLLIGLIYTS